MSSFGNGVTTCMSGSNMKGFILSSAEVDLCQTLGVFGETSASSYPASSVSFTVTTISSVSSTVSIINTGPVIDLIPQDKLYQVSNDCCLI